MAWATPDTYEPGAWVVERGAYGYDFTNQRYATTGVNGPTGDKSASLWVRNYGTISSPTTGYAPLAWGGVSTLTNGVALIFDIDPNVSNSLTSWTVTQIGASNGFLQAIDGLWHCIAFTNTGNMWTMYFDGVQRASFTLTTATTAGQISIGAIMQSPVVYRSKGMVLDDIRVYDRVLNSEEIRLLARYRGIAYTPARHVIYGGEDAGGGGVAGPVLFHSHYMSQGMRP